MKLLNSRIFLGILLISTLNAGGNATSDADSKAMETLKKGYEIVQTNCASCHLTPFDTAKIYTKREWKNRFGRPSLAEEARLRFYKKHKMNETLFNSLINTMSTYESKAFLYYYSKDSGRTKCPNKK